MTPSHIRIALTDHYLTEHPNATREEIEDFIDEYAESEIWQGELRRNNA